MRILAVFLLLPFATNAYAFDGKYTGQYDGQTMVLRQKSKSSYSFSLKIVADGCIGEVTAFGKAKGTSLTAVAKVDSQVCKLTVKKTAKGATVTEGDGCMSLHGVSCSFDGQYTKISQ